MPQRALTCCCRVQCTNWPIVVGEEMLSTVCQDWRQGSLSAELSQNCSQNLFSDHTCPFVQCTSGERHKAPLRSASAKRPALSISLCRSVGGPCFPTQICLASPLADRPWGNLFRPLYQKIGACSTQTVEKEIKHGSPVGTTERETGERETE